MMRKNTGNNGFTLIELAVVLAAAGFLMAGLIGAVRPYVENSQQRLTEEKLQRISKALSSYAITYNRLPCPAASNPAGVPFGAPRNSGPNGTDMNLDCGALPTDYTGIVPFRALGLTEEDGKDAWGNLITYVAMPILAGFDPGNQNVHGQCRIQNVWIQGANMNPKKARFCCPPYNAGPAYRIIIDDARSVGITLFTTTYGTGSYGNVDTPVALPATAGGEDIAFLLISHGMDGDGAFVKNGPQRVTSVPVSAEESENRNGDIAFVWRPMSLARNNTYFDDIMLWKTNTAVYSAFGDNSCARP